MSDNARSTLEFYMGLANKQTGQEWSNKYNNYNNNDNNKNDDDDDTFQQHHFPRENRLTNHTKITFLNSAVLNNIEHLMINFTFDYDTIQE